MAATDTSASRSPRAKRITRKLRGDGKPHAGLINMLDAAIAKIEAGDVDEGRKLAELAGRGEVERTPGVEIVEPVDSRATERLIALWRYEVDPQNGGCSIFEELPDLLELAEDPAGLKEAGEDLTPEQLEHAARDAQLISDRVLLALVEAGYYERALAFVENIARLRRECDARSGAPRAIPFGREEWERLAKQVGRIDSIGMVRNVEAAS